MDLGEAMARAAGWKETHEMTMCVVFTGAGPYPRDACANMANIMGWEVQTSVNARTNYLVASRTDTVKAVAAQRQGVLVITYERFDQLFAERPGQAAPASRPVPDVRYTNGLFRAVKTGTGFQVQRYEINGWTNSNVGFFNSYAQVKVHIDTAVQAGVAAQVRQLSATSADQARAILQTRREAATGHVSDLVVEYQHEDWRVVSKGTDHYLIQQRDRTRRLADDQWVARGPVIFHNLDLAIARCNENAGVVAEPEPPKTLDILRPKRSIQW